MNPENSANPSGPIALVKTMTNLYFSRRRIEKTRIVARKVFLKLLKINTCLAKVPGVPKVLVVFSFGCEPHLRTYSHI